LKYNNKWKAALNKLEVPEEDHKAFLVAHEHAFEALALVLKRDEDELRKAVFDKKQYDKPNWSVRQADFNGQLRQLVTLLNLLEG
jgi:hypothetical protein